MLPPEYLENLPDEIVELWAKAEQEILKDMARRLASYDYWIPAIEHQAQVLREAGRTREEILQALGKILGTSDDELRKIMVAAGSNALRDDAATYYAAGLNPPDIKDSEDLNHILNAGYQATAQTMVNLTRTTANTATQQFEAALDRAWLKISSGAFDYNAAIRSAVKELCEQGISAIRYPGGHVDSIEVAVRRAVLTGINQTAAQLQLELADELDCDLVEVSAHAGARPSHALWQGKIYSRSGKSTKYPDFRASTGYGTGPGLCGWNCRHTFGPYIEGSPRVWTDEKLAELNEKKYEYNGKKLTEYEASQMQRYNERQIRRWKREYGAMEAAGQDTSEAAAKLRSWQERQKDFLNQTGLRRDYSREDQHAFGYPQANRADKEAEAFYQRWAKDLGVSDAIKRLANYYDVKYNDTPRYKLLQTYAKSVQSGKLSPMARFDRYEEYYNRIQNELVGKQTTNGIRINGQTKHFLERVFGTMIDPDTGKPRSGVNLDDLIHCVLESTNIENAKTKGNGKPSVLIYGDRVAVSINPSTGNLIQTNPYGE